MGRFVGKQADGYETRIGRLLPGYELLHLLSRAQLLARLPERARPAQRRLRRRRRAGGAGRVASRLAFRRGGPVGRHARPGPPALRQARPAGADRAALRRRRRATACAALRCGAGSAGAAFPARRPGQAALSRGGRRASGASGAVAAGQPDGSPGRLRTSGAGRGLPLGRAFPGGQRRHAATLARGFRSVVRAAPRRTAGRHRLRPAQPLFPGRGLPGWIAFRAG